MPAWARPQRAAILERLRHAGCVLCEEDEHRSTLHSLDGTLRVSLERSFDERSGPWETVRLERVSTDAMSQVEPERLLQLTSRGTPGVVRFPRAGHVTLAVTDRYARPLTLYVDAEASSFRVQADGPEISLALLENRLGYDDVPENHQPVQARPSLRSELGTLLSSFALAASGAWMAHSAETSTLRWVGAACGAFFALSCVVVLRDLLQRGK
jgi:hypothetical protein